MIFDSFNSLIKSIDGEGRLMAVDVGTKRIGIAVSDRSRMIASPKTTINRKSNLIDFAKIKVLIEENDVKAVLVGLPLNMDESENTMSQFSRRFTKNLDEFLGDVKICFYDERLTSFMAKDDMNNAIKGNKNKKKTIIDQIAASLILQSALDEPF